MLAEESIGRLLWTLSLPAGVGMFVMSLYNVVDTIFIGHAVGALGIAGLSIVFPVQMLTMGVGQMVGIGGASLLSRSLGARDLGRAERALGNGLLCVVAFAVLLTTVGLSNSSFWARLFGASETTLPYTRAYLDIILMGTVFQAFSMAVNNLVRAEGNARVPMTAMVIGAILNIVLDAVFIMALGMGVRGAAIATVLSQVVTSLYLASYYLRGRSSVRLRLEAFVPDVDVVKEVLFIGFASFVRTTAGSLVAIVLNRTLVAYGGDLAVAAYGLVNRVMMFAGMPIIALGQGLQPVLGFNYGARRADRALRAIRLSVMVATVFSIIGFVVLVFCPSPLMRIFTNELELVDQASHAATLVFLALYLVGFQIIGSTVFQAIGKAAPAFLTATSRQILFLIPLVLVLPRFLQIDGVWLSFPIADALSFVLTLALFVPQVRGLRGLVRPEGAPEAYRGREESTT